MIYLVIPSSVVAVKVIWIGVNYGIWAFLGVVVKGVVDKDDDSLVVIVAVWKCDRQVNPLIVQIAGEVVTSSIRLSSQVHLDV